MRIRTATLDDLTILCHLENLSFPPNEAACEISLYNRIQVFPDHFWVLEALHNGQPMIMGFINGMVTNQRRITDDLFEDAGLHEPEGAWQSVFGLAVAPTVRRQGYGAALMSHLINQSRATHKCGITLTCKEHLIPYYEKFGFRDEGISASMHGGAVWHDMIIEF